MMIKWPQVINTEGYINDLTSVLRSENWTIRSQNPTYSYFTEVFEKKWAEFCGMKHALLVSSGSSAIEIALRALNIKRYDEVIIPALGWYATAAAVTKVGATPVFCDIDMHTTCLSSELISNLITVNTKAIIAVHLHCSFAKLLALKDICIKNNITLLEDAAQAHGATYLNYAPGHYSLAACYSFNQEKLIPAGEGGAIVTNDSDFYNRAYALRTDGHIYIEDEDWIPSGILGSNFAISEFQSAVLLNSLRDFHYFNDIRLMNAKRIYEALDGIEDVTLIKQSSEISCPYFYEIGIKFSDKILSQISLDEIIVKINCDNIIKVGRTDEPVPINPLFRPYFVGKDHKISINNSLIIYNSMIVMHHKFLLLNGIEKVLSKSIMEILR